MTLLDVFGDMAVAGAETLEAQLPAVKQAERPVVILRLRAQESVGSSFIAVVERYSQQLKAHDGKLMLAGVHPKVKGQLDRTGTTDEILGAENVFEAETTTLGASTRAALAAAEQWLRETPTGRARHSTSTHGRKSSVVGTSMHRVLGSIEDTM